MKLQLIRPWGQSNRELENQLGVNIRGRLCAQINVQLRPRLWGHLGSNLNIQFREQMRVKWGATSE